MRVPGPPTNQQVNPFSSQTGRSDQQGVFQLFEIYLINPWTIGQDKRTSLRIMLCKFFVTCYNKYVYFLYSITQTKIKQLLAVIASSVPYSPRKTIPLWLFGFLY